MFSHPRDSSRKSEATTEGGDPLANNILSKRIDSRLPPARKSFGETSRGSDKLRSSSGAVAHHKSGFTLIELSIVLVIIGLIIGGVLVGQDLIKAAEIRSGIAQIEKYNTAVNTLKLKYNCLAGDCPNARQLGLTTSASNYSSSSSYANGNGNGIILENHWSDGTFQVRKSTDSSETWNFWLHLSKAEMIADNMLGSAWTATGPGAGYSPTMSCNCMQDENVSPKFKAFSNANLWPWYYQGNHYWAFLIKVPSPSNGHAFGFPFTPLLAQQIDAKIDDGMPNSGTVLATREGDTYAGDASPQFNNPRTAASAGAAGCTLTTVTPNTYNVEYKEQYCNLNIKTTF